MATPLLFPNPFRPGAGQLPPHLAGRKKEIDYFEQVTLTQNPILANLIISGLRGVGKTVLLDSLKPIAIRNGWVWAGSDLSESVSVSEQNLSIRLMTDLASSLSSIPIFQSEKREIGFGTKTHKTLFTISPDILTQVYNETFGLESDKLKGVLSFIWERAKGQTKGIILAYDEAQNLVDKAANSQYPLSLLLEIIAFMQKQQIPYLLILTGLPNLLSNLIEARTYSERMFHQQILGRLNEDESREAIKVPIQQDNCPVHLDEILIEEIVRYSGGYPYFIQYLCKEIYDSYLQQVAMGNTNTQTTLDPIIRKLDVDFYQGRWTKVTDRQKELLQVIAKLDNAEDEFTIKEIIEESKKTDTPFKSSPLNVMLSSLTESGLIYKNKHGKYSFAVPMFSHFINREMGAS